MSSVPSIGMAFFRLLPRTPCRCSNIASTLPPGCAAIRIPSSTPRAPQTQRHQSTSSFTSLEHDLRIRRISPIFDDLSPQSSYRLSTILSDFLPSSASTSTSKSTQIILPPSTSALTLPPAHHVVYFEPTKPARELLPDGTNPDQWPGEPFTRRMWAGGRVIYDSTRPLRLDGRRAVCAEFLRGARVTGVEGEEKVFVPVERRMASASAEEVDMAREIFRGQKDGTITEDEAFEKKLTLDHLVRQRLWRSEEDDLGPCSIIETRNIVFMRPRPPPPSSSEAEGLQSLSQKTRRPVKLPHETADWTHTLTPDAGLLFRFSALTFNAHAIHLDPSFAKGVEGHPGLLVHGPLTYTLLVTLLQAQLQPWEEMVKVEYRNLAPLYCHEPVTFCGKRISEGRWDVWALTPAGGLAVKGSILTKRGGTEAKEGA